VRRRFGDAVLQPNGELDRTALRRVVFADPEARQALENIVHPEVERLRQHRERALARRGTRTVVHMIPLLFEVAMEDRFDAVVLVDAPVAQRRERLLRDRGLSEAEADAIMAAQQPAEEKRELATLVIENAGTTEELERAAEAAWRELTKSAAGA
jgi:dephospho-CoA kinase